MSADTEEHLCARCAKAGKTCCQKTEIFLTIGDVNRIRSSGVSDQFWEYAAPTDEDSQPDFSYDPVWSRIFGEGGKRRILRHREGGTDCRFLTAGGCELPLAVRPLVCRLYPFDYTATTIKGVDGHFCPSPEKDYAPLLLASLEMNHDDAEACRKQIYAEIEDEFPG